MRRAKQLQVLACAASAALAISQSASASLLIYEPFDYTAGQPITGQVNNYSASQETWLQVGTAGTAAVHQIVSPGLTAPAGFPAKSPDQASQIGNAADLTNVDNKEFERMNIPNAFNQDLTPKYGANSTLYYSLLLNIPATTGLTISHTNANANNDFIIGLNNAQGSSATRPSTWVGELAIRLGSVANTYNLGIRASSTPAGTTFWTGDLTPGQTNLIVVSASLNSDASDGVNSLWVNPDSSTFGAASPPTVSGSSTGAVSTVVPYSMQSLMIGAGIATGAAPNDIYADEIRLGESWADVTAIPEPSSLALIGIGAMGLAGRRKRRRATQ